MGNNLEKDKKNTTNDKGGNSQKQLAHIPTREKDKANPNEQNTPKQQGTPYNERGVHVVSGAALERQFSVSDVEDSLLSPEALTWAKDQFDQLSQALKHSENNIEENDSVPLEIAPEDIEFGEFIGEGVYSQVFKGSCYGTQVAIKKFKNQGFDPDVLKEVRKEVRIMRSIRHPNLLLFLGACTIPGQLMIVTELMDKSFHDLDESVDLLLKLKMAKEAAKGISWLHSLTPAIIHRDLKPENILIDSTYTVVKVADFGLSLVKDHSSTEREEMKKIRGSPAFMSPEALQGEELTIKTDVYSFGMILWELITGKSPYENLEIECFEQLIEEICDKGTREIIPASCPLPVKQLITASWQDNPSNRPNFLQIIHQFDQCILEVAIEDKYARKFWKQYFSPNHSLKTEVPWASFLQVLANHLKINPNEKILQGLKMLLVKHNNCVTIEGFGNILKWFGPLQKDDSGNNFLSNMQTLFTKKWFHGDISVTEAQTRLTESEPGTFLIRFSSNPGSYALSKVIQNSGKEKSIVHIRITHRPDGKYCFAVDDKVFEFNSLVELVELPQLGLGNACSGSRYWATFRVRQLHSGYIDKINTDK